MELVTIACKSPHGLTIEGGYEYGPGGNKIKTDKYFNVTLNGYWSEWMKLHPNIQPVASLNPEPGITQIPKDVWEAWCVGQGKTHPMRLNGFIFELRDDEASGKTQLREMEGRKVGFEPIDPDKLPDQLEEAPVEGRPQLGSKPVRLD
jgi:hypothetical protein